MSCAWFFPRPCVLSTISDAFFQGIFQVLVCMNVQESDHHHNTPPDNHIKIARLHLPHKLLDCLPKFRVITQEFGHRTRYTSKGLLVHFDSFMLNIFKMLACGMYFLVVDDFCLIFTDSLSCTVFNRIMVIVPTVLLRFQVHVECAMLDVVQPFR